MWSWIQTETFIFYEAGHHFFSPVFYSIMCHKYSDYEKDTAVCTQSTSSIKTKCSNAEIHSLQMSFLQMCIKDALVFQQSEQTLNRIL